MNFPAVLIGTVSVLCCANALLLRTDVTIEQKMGRVESDDIRLIKDTLTKLTDIRILFARKAFDNQKIVLILELLQPSVWPSFTFEMSGHGYQIDVTILESCSDYAEILDVNVTYHSSSDINSFDVVEEFTVTYYDHGITNKEYSEMLKSHFEKDISLMNEGIVNACYRSLGELPVKLMYMGYLSIPDMRKVYRKVRHGTRASVNVQLMQSFDFFLKNA